MKTLLIFCCLCTPVFAQHSYGCRVGEVVDELLFSDSVGHLCFKPDWWIEKNITRSLLARINENKGSSYEENFIANIGNNEVSIFDSREYLVDSVSLNSWNNGLRLKFGENELPELNSSISIYRLRIFHQKMTFSGMTVERRFARVFKHPEINDVEPGWDLIILMEKGFFFGVIPLTIPGCFLHSDMKQLIQIERM